MAPPTVIDFTEREKSEKTNKHGAEALVGILALAHPPSSCADDPTRPVLFNGKALCVPSTAVCAPANTSRVDLATSCLRLGDGTFPVVAHNLTEDICLLIEEYLGVPRIRSLVLAKYNGYLRPIIDKKCREWTVTMSTYPTQSAHRPSGRPAQIFYDKPVLDERGDRVLKNGNPVFTAGTRVWRHFGTLHRLNGPAVEYHDGTVAWFRDGKLHRVGGPAVQLPNGYCAWYDNGILSNIGGPAVRHPDGKEEWRVVGKLHREDGPAVSGPSDPPEYYYGGNRHRVDGPAHTTNSHDCTLDHYYAFGKHHRTDGPAIIKHNKDGMLVREEYYFHGARHRLDDPAVREWVSSPTGPILIRESYFCYEKLHRIDGPANRTWSPTGQLLTEEWHIAGKHHRLDGPSKCGWSADGDLVLEEWRLFGVLHRDDGPACIHPPLSEYYLYGSRHRLDGPAVTTSDNSRPDEYYCCDKLHRFDGPATSVNNKPRNYVFDDLVSKPTLARLAVGFGTSDADAPPKRARPPKKSADSHASKRRRTAE